MKKMFLESPTKLSTQILLIFFMGCIYTNWKEINRTENQIKYKQTLEDGLLLLGFEINKKTTATILDLMGLSYLSGLACTMFLPLTATSVLSQLFFLSLDVIQKIDLKKIDKTNIYLFSDNLAQYFSHKVLLILLTSWIFSFRKRSLFS